MESKRQRGRQGEREGWGGGGGGLSALQAVLLVHSLPMKSRKKGKKKRKKKKRLSRDVYILLPLSQSSLVHDVTKTDCWAQNGSSHGHIFATFKRRFLTNRNRNRLGKKCVSFIFIYYV